MTDVTTGAISYQFKADTSNLKQGLTEIKTGLQQMADSAKTKMAEITSGMQNFGRATDETTAKIRRHGEIVGNAAYEYGPWTGVHVQAAQTIGTRLVEAIAKASIGVKALSIGFVGMGVALGASIAIVALGIDHFRELDDTMKALSVSTDAIKNLNRAGVGLGIDTTQMNSEMTSFAKKLREASVAGGDLADFLKKNNIAIKDAAGNLRPVQQIFGDIGDLIKNSGNELDKLAAMDKLGFSADMRRMFEDGAAAVQEFANTATTTQDDTNAKLIAKYQVISQAWHDTMGKLGDWAVEAAYFIISTFENVASKVAGVFSTIVSGAKAALSALEGDAKGFNKNMDAAAASWGDVGKDTTRELTVHPSAGGAAKPRSISGLYDKADKGASKAAKDPAADAKDSIEKYIDSLNKAKDVAQAESETWMLSNVERAKAVALAQAKAAADRDGLTVSDQQKQKIVDTVTITQNLKDKTDGLKAAAQSLGESFSNALDQLIVKGGKLNDVLKNLMQSLASSVLKGTLMGEGPFASIFGGPAGSGGLIGGGLKSLFNIGGARADGGPVMGGKAYVVGERGPELFQPNGGGSIVPNGGGSGGGSPQTTVHINVVGATGNSEVQRMVAAGSEAMVRHFSAQVLPGRLSEINLRGG
jgi:hypothetical protein